MKLPSLRIIGAWGAALTVVILAMSVLLRLGTRIEAGEAVSMLPGAMEQAARIAHRLAAMGVGVLAALALVLAWKEHPVPRARRYAVVAIVGLTLLLASIGRYTPGYRIDAVTIANVAGGVALAAAFALLRAAGGPETRIDGVAAGALGLLLVLAGLGAATDAAALRGEHAFGPVHFWVAALFIGLALAAAWHTTPACARGERCGGARRHPVRARIFSRGPAPDRARLGPRDGGVRAGRAARVVGRGAAYSSFNSPLSTCESASGSSSTTACGGNAIQPRARNSENVRLTVSVVRPRYSPISRRCIGSRNSTAE